MLTVEKSTDPTDQRMSPANSDKDAEIELKDELRHLKNLIVKEVLRQTYKMTIDCMKTYKNTDVQVMQLGAELTHNIANLSIIVIKHCLKCPNNSLIYNHILED